MKFYNILGLKTENKLISGHILILFAGLKLSFRRHDYVSLSFIQQNLT